jgi:hypothetical protein
MMPKYEVNAAALFANPNTTGGNLLTTAKEED